MRLFKTPTNTPDYCSAAPAADRQYGSFKALSGKGSAPASPPPFPDDTHTVTGLSPLLRPSAKSAGTIWNCVHPARWPHIASPNPTLSYGVIGILCRWHNEREIDREPWTVNFVCKAFSWVLCERGVTKRYTLFETRLWRKPHTICRIMSSILYRNGLSTFSEILSNISGICQLFQYDQWQQYQEKSKKLSTKSGKDIGPRVFK